ncbi:hypothetical protein VTH06DRAFT_4649 [Thermothelomyces fergusii]
MASSHRSKRAQSKSKGSREPPEILQQVGRAVLSYALKKLSERQAQSETRSETRSQSAHRRSTRTRASDPSSASGGSRSRDLPRSESGDIQTLISQLVVGAFALGIRALVRHRKEAKKEEVAATVATQNESRPAKRRRQPGQDVGADTVDPELLAALDSIATELQSTSDSIRRLFYSVPPHSHHDCAICDVLLTDADRLSGSLANLQASINNVRNLHPSLVQEMGWKDPVRERPRKRTLSGEMTEDRGGSEGVDQDRARERQRKRH